MDKDQDISYQEAENLPEKKNELGKVSSAYMDMLDQVQDKESLTKNKLQWLEAKTANEWMAQAEKEPIMKKLCGELWHEGEVCILFASTNDGKTILAVQIAIGIARGGALFGMFKVEVDAQKIGYLDCELSYIQHYARYANKKTKKAYEFPDNYIRLEIKSDPEEDASNLKRSLGEVILQEIEVAIQEHKIKVFFVDNLSWLNTNTENGQEAIELMQKLKGLAKKYSISILVVAHTPKRSIEKRLSMDDLSGSSKIAAFADSIIAIGKRLKPVLELKTQSSYKYIKQLKARVEEIKYGDNNVICCKIEKQDDGLLYFKILGYDRESRQLNPKDQSIRDNQIHRLNKEGKSQHAIAEELGISSSTVNKVVNKNSNEFSLVKKNDDYKSMSDESKAKLEQERANQNKSEAIQEKSRNATQEDIKEYEDFFEEVVSEHAYEKSELLHEFWLNMSPKELNDSQKRLKEYGKLKASDFKAVKDQFTQWKKEKARKLKSSRTNEE